MYSVEISPASEKQIKSIDNKKDRKKILERIEQLKDNPRPPKSRQLNAGKKDEYEIRRVRQGNWRII